MVDIITSERADEYFKNKQGKIVVAGGCFDLLHIGHITLLENAKKEGDLLVVLLESDASIKKKKGIDVVILLRDEMHDEDYDLLLQEIKPAVIATTEDDPYIIHKQRQAEKFSARVVAVNAYIPHVSTTKLLDILSKER